MDDLLDFTGIVKGKLQLHPATVDLHDTVSHAISMCERKAEAKGLVLSSRLDAASHCIRGDAGRLAQVVWNALLNAVKFTPAPGQVLITSSNPAPGTVRLTVSDTGIGIEPELLPHIFEPFRQSEGNSERRLGGLGLGLSVAKGLVDAHGGTISASSEGPGLGTTLTIDFTVVEPPAPAAGAGDDKAAARATRPLRLLLVEDHEDTRAILFKMLTRQGHQVHGAGSVAEGLELFHQHEFDVLISDIGLPDGTGRDLLLQMGAARPVYALALSGFGMPEDLELSRKAGFFQHLTKPISVALLKQLLQQFAKSIDTGESKVEAQVEA